MHFSLQINWIKIKNLLWNQKTDNGGKRKEKRRKKGFEIKIKIATFVKLLITLFLINIGKSWARVSLWLFCQLIGIFSFRHLASLMSSSVKLGWLLLPDLIFDQIMLIIGLCVTQKCSMFASRCAKLGGRESWKAFGRVQRRVGELLLKEELKWATWVLRTFLLTKS